MIISKLSLNHLSKKSLTYDYIIVGAGIAGLYTAYRINQKHPKAKICILEASKTIGGRLHTIHYDNLQFESGGARFNTEQHRMMTLVKELKLSKLPITNTINYIPINPKYDKSLETIFPTIDSFIKYMKKYIKDNQYNKTSQNITDDTLINTTILDFASRYFSKEYPTIKQYIIDIYPYYSELGVLNALEGINLFSNEFSDKTQYYILQDGLQQITIKLYNILKSSLNVKIYTEMPLGTITKEIVCSSHIFKITSGTEEDNNIKNFITKHIILAIPKLQLLKIKYLTQNKLLLQNINSIQTEPLYRIYARYPANSKTGKVWFDGFEKISTNLSIKYIIPISSEKGLIMISYTDSKFAKYWLNKVLDDTFEKTLNKQLKQLFPEVEIPKAKWYKHCYWEMGAGYWKPYSDSKKIIPQMIQPIDNENIYICGENYSSHQAWCEGSLETSELVLEKLSSIENNIKKIKYKSNKLTKKYHSGGAKIYKQYTLDEVAKHNTKSDAWIVIEGKVANITKWIPKHPGGDIIMKGVGKDATKMFKSIGHDEYAKKMLQKYQIGILKR
jgi:monoamine oxidase